MQYARTCYFFMQRSLHEEAHDFASAASKHCESKYPITAVLDEAF